MPYSLEATINRFYDTNYLSAVGPTDRKFFCEAVPASQQIIPFLRLYAQWAKQDNISLSNAVDQSLSL